MLEQIARHLAFCGLGTVDEDIFWGRMPDAPDECLCVYSSDSGVPGKLEGSRVQIVNRGRTPGAAYEKACAVLHRKWAERLRKGEALPDINRRYFGA